MSRVQVRDVVGTPLVASVFHNDRWDYVFTLKRRGVEPQRYQFSVFFVGDVLDRTEGGDTLPAEEEFVERLAGARSKGKVPRLEATPEELSKFQAANPPGGTGPGSDLPSSAAPASYPPLEQPAR